MDEERLQKTIAELADVNRELVRRQSFWRSFFSGVIYGVGATVGAAIIIALIVGALHRLSTIDSLKPAIEDVLPYFDRSRNVKPSLESSFPRATYITPSPSPSVEVSPQI